MPDNTRRRRSLPMILSGGAVSSPLDVPGLVAWYDFSDVTVLYQDAARTVAVTSTSDPIGGVVDKSLLGHNLTSSTDTTTRPLYQTGIQNGKSAALFDNSNDHLYAQFSATYATSTTFVIAKKVSGTANAYIHDGWDATHRHAAVFSNNLVWIWEGAVQLNSSALTITNMALYSFVYTASTTSRGYHNGLQVITNGNSGNHSLTGLRLGENFSGASFPLNGYIGELIVYNSVLSDASRKAIEAYLNKKWAIF